jgi:hypothetical protein
MWAATGFHQVSLPEHLNEPLLVFSYDAGPAGSFLGIASGLQFLQLALDQAFGVLRIGGAQWSQSDGGATFWDDHEISPNQRVTFHRHVVNIRKRNRYRSSLANDFRVDELDTVFVDSQTLITY